MNQSILFAESTLRRNYHNLQFCPQNNREDLRKSAGQSIGRLKGALPGFKLVPFRGLSVQNLPFTQQLLLPYELAKLGKLEDAYLVLDAEKALSATINLDEHLVLKSRGAVDELTGLTGKVRELENSVSDPNFPFAKDEQYGYLSYRPLLAGSGLYINLLLHLPILHYLKQIYPLIQMMREQGLLLRPASGYNSKNPARLFILSNLSSLNMTDRQVLELVQKGALQLIQKERALQEKALNGSAHSIILDKLWRSYGILQYARRLDANDFLVHWSGLRLGASSGILPVSLKTADSLLVYGNDQVFREKEDQPNTFIFQRADAVRLMLSGG
ncbi:MAG: hypothetical protein QM308_09795 [Bacillota bacterium]|nr:hypothetical protein [Bacillota bacterium]